MGTAYLNEFLYSGQEFAEIEQWRARILTRVLLVIFSLACVAVLPALYFTITAGPTPASVADGIALALLAVVTFRRQMTVKVRATILVSLFYLVGVWFLVTVGMVSQIYLLAFPVMTALFLGLRPAFAALALNGVTLGILGYINNSSLTLPNLERLPTLKWVMIAVNFTFVDAVLTLSAAILLQKLERSLEMQKVAARSIDLRQMELSRMNAELAKEVEARRKSEEEKMQLARAVGQLREIILMTDPHGKIVYANRAFEVLSGRSLKSMSVLWLQQLRTLSDSGESIAEIVKAQKEWSGVVEFISVDGAPRKMETVISPSRDPNGQIENFVAVMRESEVVQWM
jgi:PAS domain S-box-containing protein